MRRAATVELAVIADSTVARRYGKLFTYKAGVETTAWTQTVTAERKGARGLRTVFIRMGSDVDV